MSGVRGAYDRWSASYDHDANTTRDLDAEVLRRLELPWGELAAVEIGCGTGKNSVFLAERCRSLVGLDLSPGMLAKARERVPTARFLEADLAAPWPLPTASADVVLADLVLEHLADVGAALAEAGRVARDGGWLWVSELHPDRQARGKGAHYFEGGERVDVPAVVHTADEYVGAAVRAGFVVERLRDERAATDDSPRLFTLLARRSARGR